MNAVQLLNKCEPSGQKLMEGSGFFFAGGALAEKIDAFSRATGGYLRREDLAAYRPQWVEPVSVNYRGYDVWEIPPNGSGIVAQMALNILKGFDSPRLHHK